MATAYLLQLIIEMTDAKTDQEHLDILIFNRPQVPDRTAYILDKNKPSPLPPMEESAKTLESLGASCICAPCVTSHYFYHQLSESVNIPFINMLTETARELSLCGKKKVGIMATTGTVSTGLFQSAFRDFSLEPCIPSQECQSLVMSLIYDEIKAGLPADPEKFKAVSRELYDSGCDSIVLGCTELSLIKKATPPGPGFLDALEVLAKRCVQACGGRLKTSYTHLIT